jgi:hypothetical protein
MVSRAEFYAQAARIEDVEDAFGLGTAAAEFDERDTLPVEMVKRWAASAFGVDIDEFVPARAG